MNNHDFLSNAKFDRRYLNFIKKWWLELDKINFFIILFLMIFGLVMTFSSSSAIAKRIEIENLFFVKKELIFAVIALFLMIIISSLDVEKIKILAVIGMFFLLIALMLVLAIGSEAKGAKRWIHLPMLTIQPSEFVKIFFILCNALILEKFYYDKWWKKYLISFSLFAIIAALLLLQPDIGMTTIFIAIWLCQIFICGIPLRFVSLISIAAIIGISFAYLSFPHVQDRVNRFLDDGEKNYQVERSIDAFVSGSFLGKGAGNGVVKNFIPDAHTDFIFAVIGEEFGIIGCTSIIICFCYLFLRIVRSIIDENDFFIYLALSGSIIQITLQALINICVSLKLVPTKGMTLPLISYGGSSLLASAIAFGVILALTKKRYHRDVDYGNVKFF
jgi:cell division protein FtsW